jgi:hypothetical protein
VTAAARTPSILGRFPQHLQADDPGKLFASVVDGLAFELDVKSSQLRRVRRSRAIADADEEPDLLLIAGLHGLRRQDFEILRRRLAAVQQAYGARLDHLRETIRAVVGLHRRGSGTIGALLGAAAAYLRLAVDNVVDADDDFWHVATCSDRLTPSDELDVIALEENPFQPKEIDPSPRRHGERFHTLRSGFDLVPVAVRIVGVEDRTVMPMIVNRDTGRGLVYVQSVPDGEELRFEADGRVTLGGTSAGRLAYAFHGAVFADADARDDRDFAFDGEATFAVTEPAPDAFEPGAVFPHSEALLPPPTMAVGETRWAFFVRAAHYAGDGGVLPLPTLVAGVFDASVFEPAGDAAAKIGFAWQDREPFAATLWVPKRFAELDGENQVPVREVLRLLLDRHRAAGIHVYVKYADDSWGLGVGVLREQGSAEPIGTVVAGTRLPETT